jgi:hypothetical protein
LRVIEIFFQLFSQHRRALQGFLCKLFVILLTATIQFHIVKGSSLKVKINGTTRQRE